jgi:hypothetical protein
MSPRTFFTIVIKILGIYLLLDYITLCPQIISTISYNSGAEWQGIVFATLILLAVIIYYIILLRLLLFKTGWLIDKLALDKNFPEEKIEINIHRSTVLSIAVIVTGALIFVDALPSFCKEVFNWLQQRSISERLSGYQPSKGWLVFYFAKAFIGCCMMIYQRVIVNFIELKRKVV